MTKRTQRVQIDQNLSDAIEVPSSVVQGSHLGPILFTIFINDVSEVNNAADAVTLQNALNRLETYVQLNRLKLNLKKCSVMSFTKRTTNFIFHPYEINGVELERTNTMRDLGVIFDTNLTFHNHIDSMCGKARRMLGFIMRVGKHFKDKYTHTTLYNSLVRSNLEYASTIWNPHTAEHKLKIERVQHKFLRFVSGTRLRR